MEKLQKLANSEYLLGNSDRLLELSKITDTFQTVSFDDSSEDLTNKEEDIKALLELKMICSDGCPVTEEDKQEFYTHMDKVTIFENYRDLPIGDNLEEIIKDDLYHLTNRAEAKLNNMVTIEQKKQKSLDNFKNNIGAFSNKRLKK
jgi:hypothetical protein